MRKKIVAGNWKMNLRLEEGMKLSSEIVEFVKNNPLDSLEGKPGVIMFTPFVHLTSVAEVIAGIKGVAVGAQNCHTEEKGAFTGEISAEMIESTGATHVLVGHSERRSYFSETDEVLAKKTEIALKHGLIPVFCCGEVLDERNAAKHFDVVKEQLYKGLFWLTEEEFSKVVIAYEPVWAIGTGVTASPEQAQEMHAYIRQIISEKYNDKIADDTTILYGGSCNAKNAAELFANEDVDGGLIGGASLKAEDFCTIIKSF
ncbi:MAG: triose-phosphate isomerase [Bacteroidales bacterium]|nr:triose-phosphate isomerase [Bacteroidales bacterium]